MKFVPFQDGEVVAQLLVWMKIRQHKRKENDIYDALF
jgi:hypothetical protein